MQQLQALNSGTQLCSSEHSTAPRSRSSNQHSGNQPAAMSQPHIYAAHNTQHAAVAQLPQLSHTNDTTLQAAAAELSPQTRAPLAAQSSSALSPPVQSWQQQHHHLKDVSTPGSAYDLEHDFPTGDLRLQQQQQQQHSLQPPAQYAQYNLWDWHQQCQHMPSGARLPEMLQNAVQPCDRPAQQYPSAVSQSPFSGNPFSDPYPQTSVHAQQVTFPDLQLRLPSVHTSPASSRAPNLNPQPVQPEIASPPSTPDSFTSIELQQYQMHTQQQQHHPIYPVHQFQRQPVVQFPNNMPGARVPSPLGIPTGSYSTNSGISHHCGSNNPLPDSSSNVRQQQQQPQYQHWSQPSSEYTTPRGTFEDAGTAASATAATAAGPGNVQQQVSGSSKEDLLKLALLQAAGQQEEDVDQLLQQLLGALASATRSTGPNSRSSSSRSGAASSTSGAYTAGQAAPISDAAPSLPSTNPFANLEATPINAGGSPARGAIPPSVVPYADSQQCQQHQQPAAAGLPSRLRAGHITGATAAASATEQAATVRHSGVSVPGSSVSDGGASLMPVTPFATGSAGAQEALYQHLQDPWQQGWRASGDKVVHNPAAMHMQVYNQQMQQQHQQCMSSFEAQPIAQQPMLPPTAAIDQGQQQQQPSSQHQIIPVGDMWLARRSTSDTAGQDSSVPHTGSGHAAVATNFYPGSILAPPTAGPHATAVAAQMQAILNAAAMATTPMLVPAAVLAAPAAMQAAAAAPQSLSSFNPNMAFAMYPVPMPMPVAAAAAAANMQYYQMMQQQQQLYQAAAAAGSQTATAASLAPGQHDMISVQPSNSMTSAGSISLVTAAADAGVAGDSGTNDLESSNRSLVLQHHSSTDASMLASCSTAAAEMPALFPAAGWPMSGIVAAVAWLLGKGFGVHSSKGLQAQWAGNFNSAKAEELAVSPPVGLHGPGLSVVGQASSFPMAVAIKARDAAAQGVGLVAHSGAAFARMYFIVCVWYAHYLLVLVLYSLLAMTSVGVASQQLVTSAGKLAAAGTVQLGLFAARQARMFTSAAVRVISSDLEKLPQQVLLQPLLVIPSMSAVHSKQLLLTEAPSASLTNGAVAAVLPTESTAFSRQASDTHGSNTAALLSWPQVMMGMFNSSSGAKPGTVGTAVTAAVADKHDASSSGVQQLASSGSGRIASAAAPVQCQQTELQQRYNLYVADSVSVISGLWAGLGVKLWMLVAIQVPFEASRIWLQACGQGVSFSAAAAAAATRYALHAAWLVVQCSALILDNTKLRLPQVCAASVGLVGRTATAAFKLSCHAALFSWMQLGSNTITAAQAMLKSTAESVPGGMGLLQCLNASAGLASNAVQHFSGGMRHAWHWLASADEQAWKSLTMHSLLTQVFSWGLAAAAWGSGEIFGLVTNLSVAATNRVLRGAPPMAQAAVWGSAGMLKRLVLEAAQQSWLLLLGLYHAWQEQQRQQQQQQC